jgi:hypothetical protein
MLLLPGWACSLPLAALDLSTSPALLNPPLFSSWSPAANVSGRLQTPNSASPRSEQQQQHVATAKETSGDKAKGDEESASKCESDDSEASEPGCYRRGVSRL